MNFQPIYFIITWSLAISISFCGELLPVQFLLGIVEKKTKEGSIKEKQKCKPFVEIISLGMGYLMFFCLLR